MKKFWPLMAIVGVLGVATLALPNQQNRLMINDLETECRGDRGEMTQISLQGDNSLRFNGYFPVENTNSNLNIDYKGGSNVVLNIKSQSVPAPEFLWHNCLASGVYDLETEPLKEGRRSVEIKHNGERVEKRIIQVKN